MKKIVVFILIIFLFIPTVYGKTINDLYDELETLKTQKSLYIYLSNDDVKRLLENSLDIELIIDSLNDEIDDINKKINIEEDNINILNKEIDEIMIFNQISKGENIYLEYIFDSSSYSEMIYRYMALEQLNNYNNGLIKAINKKIEELNNDKEELSNKVDKLNKEREKYRELSVILKNVGYLENDSIMSNIDDDINSIVSEIQLYEKMGCSRNIDISLCLKIRSDYNFMYPLIKGCVSQEYSVNHKGIDLACNLEGTNVYSSANGIVSYIEEKSTYGGNIVYIYHIINGKPYTTIYGHLLEIKVNVGDEVASDTVIGLLGGESTAYINGGYDKGTNGAHLHFAVVEGFHISDFNIYTLNPSYFNTYPSLSDGYFNR